MDSSKDKFILHSRVDLLYRNSYAGLRVTIIAALGLCLGFNGPNGVPPEKLMWLSLMLVVVFLRGLDTHLWKKQLAQCKQAGIANLNRFRVGAFVTAILWAFYCLYFYPNSNIYQLAASMIIVSAMAGGAATVLSGDVVLSIGYAQILLLPYSSYLVFSPHNEFQVLGFLGFAFSFFMFFIALKAGQYTLESIKLRHENMHLINHMQHEVNARTKQIVELSQIDSLTKLLNRSAFIDQARELISKGTKTEFSIFFIDLDGFKPVNDNFGHNIGDQILSELATRLKKELLEVTFICRWGGDEFIVLAEAIDTNGINNLAMHLKKIITQPFQIENYNLEIDASIGVAIYPEHSQDLTELVSFADVSMYHNKHANRSDFIVFSSVLAEMVQHEYMLSAEIRKAVKKKQLHLVYQPIIEAKSGKIHAVEALLRWKLNGKMIPPDTFIPLAEKNGAILEIGYWVLEEALINQKKLTTAGYEIKMCINISVAQFEDPDLPTRISQLIERHNVNPNMVHLEITESMITDDKPKLLLTLKDLQNKGLFISIDDFGTGYSSLSVIQDTRVNIIKIDRSFVAKLTENGSSIIRAVMVMAKDMDYKVVAEGVEDVQQSELLSNLGIDYLQGYLFSKPVPYTTLIKLVNASESNTKKIGNE